jgi:hypothetical protein
MCEISREVCVHLALFYPYMSKYFLPGVSWNSDKIK